MFGTPTYMGGVAGQFKAFIDTTSGPWFKQAWKDKLGAAFTHSQGLSGDKLNTLTALWVLAMQHGMVWVGLGELPAMPHGTPDKVNRIAGFGGAMAQTDHGEKTVPAGDLETGRVLGRRVATFAAKLGK